MKIVALLAGIIFTVARPGVAQTPSTDAAIRAATVLGAPVPTTSTATLTASPADTPPAAPREFSSRAPGATMMIIGGASLLAGIIVGGDAGVVLILAGIGVGAYGLILYTRH